jgi:hypothetical protein
MLTAIISVEKFVFTICRTLLKLLKLCMAEHASHPRIQEVEAESAQIEE